MFFRSRHTHASLREFPNNLVWINSPALALAALRGKPALLHIWSYTCPHSLRSLEHVRRWAEIYAPFGVTVIGVHTPEFRFATEVGAVQEAVRELGIRYPVVHDPDYMVWKMWKNEYWPRLIIIDSLGQVVFDHAGEGAYAEAEVTLQHALKTEAPLPAIGPDASLAGAHHYRITPEVHAGYLRGSVGNLRQFSPGTEEAFTDSDQKEEGVLYAHGHYALHPECLEHTRAAAGATEYVRVKYRAFGVQAVLRSKQRTKEMIVRLDKKPVPPDFRGSDLHERADGETVVLVREGRLYELIAAKVYHAGALELRGAEAGWELYTIACMGAPIG
jgi:thiol-disulfide isomerase/thioredoxin